MGWIRFAHQTITSQISSDGNPAHVGAVIGNINTLGNYKSTTFFVLSVMHTYVSKLEQGHKESTNLHEGTLNRSSLT